MSKNVQSNIIALEIGQSDNKVYNGMKESHNNSPSPIGIQEKVFKPKENNIEVPQAETSETVVNIDIMSQEIIDRN